MYVYNADTYCDSCGAAIAQQLIGGPDFSEEDIHEGDSDRFPQYADAGESDGPDHCASGEECYEGLALDLPADAKLYGAESRTIGAWLGNSLTDEGRAYLEEMLNEPDPTPYQRALHDFWRNVYQH